MRNISKYSNLRIKLLICIRAERDDEGVAICGESILYIVHRESAYNAQLARREVPIIKMDVCGATMLRVHI